MSHRGTLTNGQAQLSRSPSLHRSEAIVGRKVLDQRISIILRKNLKSLQFARLSLQGGWLLGDKCTANRDHQAIESPQKEYCLDARFTVSRDHQVTLGQGALPWMDLGHQKSNASQARSASSTSTRAYHAPKAQRRTLRHSVHQFKAINRTRRSSA